MSDGKQVPTWGELLRRLWRLILPSMIGECMNCGEPVKKPFQDTEFLFRRCPWCGERAWVPPLPTPPAGARSGVVQIGSNETTRDVVPPPSSIDYLRRP